MSLGFRRRRFVFRKWLLISIAILLLSAWFSGVALAGKVYMSMVTGSTGGTYYPIGEAIASLVNKYVPEVTIIVETGNASVANCNLIGRHEVEMAFAQNDVANWAYNGKYLFKNPLTNIRAIASLYPELIHLVALKSSKIETIYDLKGKRVAVGKPGSGTEIDVRLILKEAGLSYKDMIISYIGSGTAAQRMKDGQIDAFFYTVGCPARAIIDVASARDIVIVPFSDSFIKRVRKKYSWFTKSVIPAGTYRGQKVNVPTLSVMAMWIADSKEPADLIYKVIKGAFDHISEIYNVHPKAKFITLDSALDGVSVPLHEGAKRYYREKGMVK